MGVAQWAIGKAPCGGFLQGPDPGFFLWMKWVEALLPESLPTTRENLERLSPSPVTIFKIVNTSTG